jgi:hypothetical protein
MSNKLKVRLRASQEWDELVATTPAGSRGLPRAVTPLSAISQVIRNPALARPSGPKRLPTQGGRASPMSDGPRSSSSHPLSRM